MDNVCRCEEDKLYQSNAVCPKCHKAGYVYYLGNSKYVAVCTNCNYYMTKEDFPLWATRRVKTNADRIRAMSDEDMAEYLDHYSDPYFRDGKGWLAWLREEYTDD